MTPAVEPPAEPPPELWPAPPATVLPVNKLGLLLDLLAGWRAFAREREALSRLSPKKFRKRAGKRLDQAAWQRRHPPGYSDSIHHHYQHAGHLTRPGESEAPRLTPRHYLERFILPLFDPPAAADHATLHAEDPRADPAPPSSQLPADKVGMLLDLLAGWLELAGEREEYGQLKPKKFRKRGGKHHLHQVEWQRRHPPGYGDAIHHHYHQAADLTWPDESETPDLTPRDYLERFVLPLFDPATSPA